MSSNKRFINLLSFVALLVFALLEVLSGLSHFNIDIFSDGFLTLLNIVKSICILIVLCVGGYDFVSSKKKGFKIIYFVAVIVFITGIVLSFF